MRLPYTSPPPSVSVPRHRAASVPVLAVPANEPPVERECRRPEPLRLRLGASEVNRGALERADRGTFDRGLVVRMAPEAQVERLVDEDEDAHRSLSFRRARGSTGNCVAPLHALG